MNVQLLVNHLDTKQTRPVSELKRLRKHNFELRQWAVTFGCARFVQACCASMLQYSTVCDLYSTHKQ